MVLQVYDGIVLGISINVKEVIEGQKLRPLNVSKSGAFL